MGKKCKIRPLQWSFCKVNDLQMWVANTPIAFIRVKRNKKGVWDIIADSKLSGNANSDVEAKQIVESWLAQNIAEMLEEVE